MASIRSWFGRRRFESALAEEIRAHLEQKVDDLVESGFSRAEAEARARREFGNVTSTQERSREVWQWRPLEDLLQDGRHTLRLMRRNPGFTAVAVLTLSLGIGANTALFSLLDSLLLRNLAVSHPEQLVRVGAHVPDDSSAGLSLPMLQQIDASQRVFSAMFAWWGDAVLNVEANGALSRSDVWAVTGNYYSELGATPEIGRLIAPQDAPLDSAAPARIAVLGYAFWESHYGGARDVIGKIVRIEGVPFTIVGVARNGFTGITPDLAAEVTVPITAEPLLFGESDVQKHLRRPDSLWLEAAGRLKPGITLERARAQLESIWPPIRESLAPQGKTPLELHQFRSLQLEIESGKKGGTLLRSLFLKPLYVLLAIAGVVLLVACVNLASLMLARAASRSYEMGVRVALGASRARLTRQMLTESLTFSMAGALGGLAFASWGSRALSSFLIRELFIVPVKLNLSSDWRILAFTAGTAILTAILFGWAPSWRASPADANRAIEQNTRTVARKTPQLGTALIVAQIALSLILLVCGGLFLRTLEKLHAVNPGFHAHGLLLLSLSPKPGGYKNIAWISYYRELNERISNLPGVTSAALIHGGPGQPIEWTEKVRIRGTASDGMRVDLAMMMPGTLRTLGIRLVRGRDFTWHDDDHSPRVAIVSEDLAAQLFPKADAIGQRLDITTEPEWQDVRVAGIVSSASLYDIRKPKTPTIYLTATQYGHYMGDPFLLIKTSVSPAALAGPLRRTVESLGREYVDRIKTIEQAIDRTVLQERLSALLSAFFAGLALLLAAIGLYGLMAYSVTRRSREIGIRMALGARQSSVQWMVLRETLLLALLGLGIGLPCAIACAHLIASMLYGVSSNDPLTLLFVSLLLLGVSALAGFLPARRAMRLDPIAALHYE